MGYLETDRVNGRSTRSLAAVDGRLARGASQDLHAWRYADITAETKLYCPRQEMYSKIIQYRYPATVGDGGGRGGCTEYGIHSDRDNSLGTRPGRGRAHWLTRLTPSESAGAD